MTSFLCIYSREMKTHECLCSLEPFPHWPQSRNNLKFPPVRGWANTLWNIYVTEY